MQLTSAGGAQRQVASATTVPEFILAPAEVVEDGLFVARFPALPADAIAQVALVDAAGDRHRATLVRLESAGQETRVRARVTGQTKLRDVSMELRVGERSLLAHTVEVLFTHRR